MHMTLLHVGEAINWSSQRVRRVLDGFEGLCFACGGLHPGREPPAG